MSAPAAAPGAFWPWARQEPERIALVDADGRRVSFGELLDAANRIANGLRDLGLGRRAGIAVLMPNCVEAYEVLMGATQIGLFFTPLNSHLAVPEIAYVLQDCEAGAFVFHERFAAKAIRAMAQIGFPNKRAIVIGASEGLRPYTTFKASQHPGDPEGRSAGMTMVYTSGTTGQPKGVRPKVPDGPPESPVATRTGVLEIFGIRPGDGVHLLQGPIHHSGPISFSAASLHVGHTVVLTDKWDAEQTLRRIATYRVTQTFMVPTMFHRLLKLPKTTRDQYDVASLQTVIHSAAPCPVAVKQAMFDWWGPVIYETYGGTEGGASVCTPQDWLRKPGTVGPPWSGAVVRILNEDGNEQPAGRIGTIYVKTAAGPPDYFKDPEKSASVRRGEFFTLGDMGYVDDEGWLFLVDRKTDMLISGGVNIYPAEIEAVLLQHPAVRDAAVIGVPNEEWGEEVKAVLELESGRDPGASVTDGILSFCRERLADYKVPRSIDFVEALPRAENGKLYKRELRDPYWRGRDKRI